MIEMLNSNPIIVLAFGVVVTFVMMFIFVKPIKSSKKQTLKKASSEEKKETGSSEENLEDSSLEKSETSDEQPESNVIAKNKKKVRKSKTKPEIVQVYKKVEELNKDTKDDSGNANDVSDEIERRAQFVKTSSKISKFIGLSDVVPSEEFQNIEEGLTEMPVQDFQEDCEQCKQNKKHFDHSRRLSRMIQEDKFDDMVDLHISDKYLKMDSDRHLCMSEKFSEKLFDRTLSMLSNSGVKVLADDDKSENAEKPAERIKSDRDYMRRWLEEKKREE